MTTSTARSTRHAMAFCSVAVLALAACGQGSTADVASGPLTGDETAEEPTATSTSVVLDAGGPDRAVIAIGRQRYVADLSDELSICRTDAGSISGVGHLDGFADGRLHIELPPEDWQESDGRWDPPSITVDLGTDADDMAIGLHAGGDVVSAIDGFEGVSQVDSFVIDGSRASGIATFVDLGQVESAQAGAFDGLVGRTGTFAIECG